jgi:hypothetical protein
MPVFKGLHLQHNIRIYVKTEIVAGTSSRKVRSEKMLQEVNPLLAFSLSHIQPDVLKVTASLQKKVSCVHACICVCVCVFSQERD